MGFLLNPPKPSPPAGSCTLVESHVGFDSICTNLASCTTPSMAGLKTALNWSTLLPTFKFCLPMAQVGVKMPEKKKVIKAGFIPILLVAGVNLDVCVDASFGYDGKTAGLPQLEVRPGVEISAEARAGIGVADEGEQDTFEASAGVKIELVIAGITFPLRWGLSLDDAKVDGVTVPGLFDLSAYHTVSLELDFLSGWMGVYARLSLGPLGLEWEFRIFDWTGITSTIDIGDSATKLFCLDFQALVNQALAGGQAAKPSCNGNVCGGAP